MRTTPALLIALALLSHICVTSVHAGESARDGSSEARAVVVPVDYAHYHDWERQYLEKHFPEHFAFGQPVSDVGEDHALIAHEKEDRYYDCFTFRMRGKQYKVYFDITKQFHEFDRQHH